MVGDIGETLDFLDFAIPRWVRRVQKNLFIGTDAIVRRVKISSDPHFPETGKILKIHEILSNSLAIREIPGPFYDICVEKMRKSELNKNCKIWRILDEILKIGAKDCRSPRI